MVPSRGAQKRSERSWAKRSVAQKEAQGVAEVGDTELYIQCSLDSSSSILERLLERAVIEEVARGPPAAPSRGSKCRSERTWGTKQKLEQPLGASWGTEQA